MEKKQNILLKDSARERLLDLLLDGKIKPGEIINRRGVAAAFKMSMAPVHEAMLQLEHEGLLQSIPRKGTVVRAFTAAEAADRRVLREAVECQAVRACRGRLIKLNREKLLPAAGIADAIEDESPARRFRAETDFHRKLIELSGSASLLEVFDRTVKILMFATMFWGVEKLSGRLASPHTELLSALETENPDEAEALMRAHINARVIEPV
jgi:DNA-binding GntR family transcriptional regulator